MSIERVSRTHIFTQTPVLARYLYDWQVACYNPNEDKFEAGEEVWLDLDDDATTKLSAKQADELNQEHAEFCAAMRDPFAASPPELSRPDCLIAELPTDDIGVFMAEIGTQTSALCQQMGWQTLFVLPYVRAPILSQDNDYRQALQATERLVELGLPRDYAGGLALDSADIAEVCAPLFWITRCNAAAPYIAFAAPGSAVVGTVCKYGNYHLDVYDKDEHARLSNALAQIGFEVPDDGLCEERFAETSAIEGRRLDLG